MHLGVAVSLARRYGSGDELDDLVQVARIGLSKRSTGPNPVGRRDTSCTSWRASPEPFARCVYGAAMTDADTEIGRREGRADQREIDAEVREAQSDERDHSADDRGRAAQRRDHAADERERAADRRDGAADEREHLADQREARLDLRDRRVDEQELRSRLTDQREIDAEVRKSRAADRERLPDGSGDDTP